MSNDYSCITKHKLQHAIERCQMVLPICNK